MAENNKGLLILLTCLVVLSLVCSLGYGIALNNKIKAVSAPDFTPINDKLSVLASNDIALGTKLDSLVDTQSTAEVELTEDKFKDECAALAKTELELKGYKELAEDEVFTDLEDKEDIKSVVIEDVDVPTGLYFDVDDGNCRVVQEIKVRYESDTSDEVLKKTVLVTTIIEDNEVDKQTFAFAFAFA